MINGFGARLTRKAARRLRRHRGVKAVSLNRGMSFSAADASGGYTCPTADATTTSNKWFPGPAKDVDPTILNTYKLLSPADGERRPGEQGVVPRDRPRRRRRRDRHGHRRRRGGLPDARWQGSRVIASAVTNPVRHGRERPLRPRHARRRADRRQQPAVPERPGGLRQVHGRRPAGEPGLGEGVRRRRQHDRPRRDLRHPVRRRQQERVQHPRHQPVAVVGHRASRTRPTRSTPPSSRPGTAGSPSWPPRATRRRRPTA